jgi:hypothetical protein
MATAEWRHLPSVRSDRMARNAFGAASAAKSLVGTLCLSLLLACSCGLANAQQVDNGGVLGNTHKCFQGVGGCDDSYLRSTIREVTFALTTAWLFGAGAELTGEIFDLIAEDSGCVAYSPRLAIIEGDNIECANGCCVITGVLISQGSATGEKP